MIVEELGGYRYEIAPDVPAAQVHTIRRGLAIARSLIASTFGEEIPARIRAKMTVKIVAIGRGNEERGGGGSAATAFDERPIRGRSSMWHTSRGRRTRRGWTREAGER